MNKPQLQSAIIIVDTLLAKGSVSYADVSTEIDEPIWTMLYAWFSENHTYGGIRITVAGSKRLTKCNDNGLKALRSDLVSSIEAIDEANKEKELDLKIKKDTLKNNKITRCISYISLAISLAAFILSIIKK